MVKLRKRLAELLAVAVLVRQILSVCGDIARLYESLTSLWG
jgi:hypothetical protein